MYVHTYIYIYIYIYIDVQREREREQRIDKSTTPVDLISKTECLFRIYRGLFKGTQGATAEAESCGN